MFRVCARNYHSYTHIIIALGIVREPTVWGFMTSKYSCTYDIALPASKYTVASAVPPSGGANPCYDYDGMIV